MIYDQLVDQFFLYSGLYIRFRLGPSIDLNTRSQFSNTSQVGMFEFFEIIVTLPLE